jgi:glycosyltransferase involved in cell wall biosynthesis
MLRVKNEARWIADVLRSALVICGRVYVLDDHSTDGTLEICQQFKDRVVVYYSAFHDLDEARDKAWMLDAIRMAGETDWILAIDGDELLMDHAELRATMESGRADCYALRVLYLWDRPDQIRSDGVYSRFWRPSLFRLRAGDTFRSTPNGGNFHCGNVPQQLLNRAQRSEVRLLHFGYMDARDRRRKFDWYTQHDPGNQVEDCYRHVIQGDPGGPAAELTLRHAGPLLLAPLGKLEPSSKGATA